MTCPPSGPGLHRRGLLKTTAALALLLALPGVARAAPSADQAASFIRSLADDLLKLLTSNLSGAELRKEISGLIVRATNVDLIGRLVLGRYVRTATPQQLQEYQQLFADYVLRSTVDRLQQYDGNTYEVTGARGVTDTDALVDTAITRTGSAPLRVVWRLRETEGRFAVIDVVVEGISLVVTQRDEFASVIQRNGFDGLLAQLRSQTTSAG
ncbi:MlaC/ttg2D family ABC transporter substrate-binding protein [Marinivivus vitaminiproducens]|uniref:MlaC/ttg2D family ABC transporter substrate-binding protein n=1 Tax=Marinivivus vitaminiproducens TaxID=3035935 RepID=UPI00279AEE3E|nr:ABC transporter substrate-binding protein [Geminicoccaceae bacterium SCSIO 64248]